MHLILVQEDSQETAMDAIVLLDQHGYSAAFPTGGASIEPVALAELAGEILAATADSLRMADPEDTDDDYDRHLIAANEVDRIGDALDDVIASLRDAEPCDCDGRGWLRMATDGDHSHAWIERCDDCARYADDYEAAAYASEDTGRPIRYARVDGATNKSPRPYLADVPTV